MITKFKLFESPDYIWGGFTRKVGQKKDLIYSLKDAVPFAFTDNLSPIVGYKGCMHRSSNITEENSIYPGRLWYNEKIITFWVYPTSEKFKKMILDLEKELNNTYNLNINFSDGWQIEVLKYNDEIITGIKNLFFDMRTNSYDDVLIPIEDYAGSLEWDEEEKALHLMTWKEKQEYYKKHGKGNFGSSSSKLPKNIPTAEYKDKKTKYKFTENFNNFIKENAEKVSLEDISYSYLDKEARAFAYIIGGSDEPDRDNYHNDLEYRNAWFENKNPNYEDFFNEEEFNKAYKIWEDNIDRKEMVVAKMNYEYHYELTNSLGYNPGCRWDKKFPGRLWIDSHIISFWEYPEADELYEVLEDIKNNTDEYINWSDDWQIEICDELDTRVIPIEEYIGSSPWSKEAIMKLHTLAPQEKHELLKQLGYKSKIKEAPGISAAEYKDKTTKYKFTENYDNKI